GQALNVSTCKRIIFSSDHYDRNSIAGRNCFLHGAFVGSNDNIDLPAQQLPDCCWYTFSLLFRVQILRAEILAFNIAEFPEALVECRIDRCRPRLDGHDANMQTFWQLCSGGKRSRSRCNAQKHEFASP